MHTKPAKDLTTDDRVVMDPFDTTHWGRLVYKGNEVVVVEEQRGFNRTFDPNTAVTLLGDGE